MNAFALHNLPDRSGPLRWTGSAAVIAALHAGLIAAALAWYSQSPPPGVAMPAILVDMAPSAAAPQTQPLDVAPGPEMQQAEETPPPPEPVQPPPVAEQPIEPTPPKPDPVVAAAPPEPRVKAEPAPPKPEPAKIIPEPPNPKKPVRTAARHPADEPPAPRTSAAPRAERQAPSAGASAATGAAAAAALPSYRDRLAAHLQRFKQYPAGAKSAGEQGTAMLSFTVSRGGQVLASRLAGSSGSAALDAETMAMIRRAQPLPSFPPEIAQASLSFTVPVRFSLR
jgi:protein TonB